MFFTQYVLSKKGPLAKIWLAAHWEKKLTKAQIYETNIDSAIESILDPKVNMALRTTGHLLLGIVRIHSRKTKYLLADCNEAFLKIKMAFRPGIRTIDISEEVPETEPIGFTLPEVFRDLDSALPDFGMGNIPDDLAAVQGRYEQITLKEDLPRSSVEVEDDFGESTALESLELAREGVSGGFDFGSASGMMLKDKDSSIALGGIDMSAPILDDDFGGQLTDVGFEAGLELFDTDAFERSIASATAKEPEKPTDVIRESVDQQETVVEKSVPTAGHSSPQVTTLFLNDEEAFVLEPVDATLNKTTERHRAKRKRRLLVDTVKCISNEDFKAQLSYDKDTVMRLEIAPFTRDLLKMRETGSLDKLWNTSSLLYRSSALSGRYAKTIGNVPKKTKAQLLHDETGSDLEFGRMYDESVGFSMVDAELEASAAGSLPPIQELELNAESISGLNALSDAGEAPSVIDIESGMATPHALTPRKPKKPSSKKSSFSRSLTSEATDGSPGERSYRWTKKSQQLLTQIQNKTRDKSEVTFKELTKGSDRKTAAQKFYNVLELYKWNAIRMHQSEPFADMHISSDRNGEF
uniref:Rad21/Rec8-like protein N-terminal domain-containing protein n=1 Tax=Trichuris muris TaxID=70415 RepID=A0A5S6Q888_TRIMR